jgi:hypothetical protein
LPGGQFAEWAISCATNTTALQMTSSGTSSNTICRL